MKFVNLTPHDVNICNEMGNTIRYVPPSGMVARVDEMLINTFFIDGIITVNEVELGDVYIDGTLEDFPQPVEDTIYIVSRITKNKLKDRRDVLAPGLAIRDDDGGKIVGCFGLSL